MRELLTQIEDESGRTWTKDAGNPLEFKWCTAPGLIVVQGGANDIRSQLKKAELDSLRVPDADEFLAFFVRLLRGAEAILDEERDTQP
jgi:hypothetical protein